VKSNYEIFKIELKKGKPVATTSSRLEFYHIYDNLAKIDALANYLGDDFVDWDCVTEISSRREHYLKYEISDNAAKKNKKHSFYPPYRCEKCTKAWSKFITPSGAVNKSKYLPNDVFNKIRLEYKDCGKCNA
jgi:esterase/lipase superfamily enzyme